MFEVELDDFNDEEFDMDGMDDMEIEIDMDDDEFDSFIKNQDMGDMMEEDDCEDEYSEEVSEDYSEEVSEEVSEEEVSEEEVSEEEVSEEEVDETVRTHANMRKAPNAKKIPTPAKKYASSRTRPAVSESEYKKELKILKEEREQYKNALKKLKESLNDVALFNSNLAYVVRLVTENSTTKNEKVNILKRFDNVKTLEESKTLFNVINQEIKQNNKPLNEAVDKLSKTPTKGSTNLVESKNYVNKDLARMIELIEKTKK